VLPGPPFSESINVQKTSMLLAMSAGFDVLGLVVQTIPPFGSLSLQEEGKVDLQSETPNELSAESSCPPPTRVSILF
jgi:hypothetical protein